MWKYYNNEHNRSHVPVKNKNFTNVSKTVEFCALTYEGVIASYTYASRRDFFLKCKDPVLQASSGYYSKIFPGRFY